MTEKADVILVAHSVHADITENEMREVVPPEWTVRGIVDIRPVRLTFGQTLGTDWIAHARAQARQWMSDVVPLLLRYPGSRIVYFGLAPIPLALHLGSLTERWPYAHVFQRHHGTRSWVYAGGTKPAIQTPWVPSEIVRSTEPVIVTVGTTMRPDLAGARQVVGSTSAEIEIFSAPLGEDILTSMEAVEEAASAFKHALDSIEKCRPSVSEVHLFAAVPVGLAFLLGTYLTETRHARLVTYQYVRSYELHHVEALRIPLRAVSAVPLTNNDLATSALLRSSWEEQRQTIATFFGTPKGHWSEILGACGETFRFGGFEGLAQASATPLVSPINLAARAPANGFRFDPQTLNWQLGDGLLASIRSFVSPELLDRAGRMLLLHEALHHGPQNLTESTAQLIRLAPKVLEELDYLADIWAMMHEFAFGDGPTREWAEQRQTLLAIIETAILTMWAFDADREQHVLEVRRVSRYLIWYVNLARIERSRSFAEAMRILANKPVVDLIGPPIAHQDGRLVMLLDRVGQHVAELCLVDQSGRLQRMGNTNTASVNQVAAALGTHDHQAVRNAIRVFVQGDESRAQVTIVH